MMLSAYLLLGWHHLLPWWLVSLVIFRDLIIPGSRSLVNFAIIFANQTPFAGLDLAAAHDFDAAGLWPLIFARFFELIFGLSIQKYPDQYIAETQEVSGFRFVVKHQMHRF